MQIAKPGFLVFLSMVGTAVHAGPPSSASYVLRQSTVNAAGQVSASARFRLTDSLATASTVEASSAPSFVLQSGFWGFVGSGPVDVVLAVDRNDANEDDIDLSWSGNSPPYDIYVANDCSNVLGSFYSSSSSNSEEGVTVPSGDLACVNVVPMAPPFETASSPRKEPKP